MIVGVDLRALQLGHQFRGIGQVVRATVRELHRRLPSGDVLVAFVDPNGPSIAPELEAMGLDGREVRVVDLAYPSFGRLRRLQGSLSATEDATIAAHCDVMLQHDFMLGIPRSTPTVLVVYDQIPLLLGDRFPTTYRPSFGAARRAGLSLPHAAKKALGRTSHERRLTDALATARTVIAISEHTAETTVAFGREHGVVDLAARVVVAPLGCDPPDEAEDLTTMERTRVEALGLAERPFFLFMGGGDERRRIDHLVAAFNHLRGRGYDAQLVLAGYDFVAPDDVETSSARDALLASAYQDDIHLLGFVSAAERAWLYHHATAFAFPTEHEGFGLPVVESLAAGCAVVAYATSAITEVAGPNTRTCEPRWRPLAAAMVDLLERSPEDAAEEAEAGRRWAARFTWDTIGEAVTEAVTTAARG